jgi:hypothetical protein
MAVQLVLQRQSLHPPESFRRIADFDLHAPILPAPYFRPIADEMHRII